jgi:hypothetical protein
MGCPSVFSSSRSYMISRPASVIAYSASVVDADTVACRFEDHTIGEPSNSMIQPVVDRRVSG